jgi:hypothetical protein
MRLTWESKSGQQMNSDYLEMSISQRWGAATPIELTFLATNPEGV